MVDDTEFDIMDADHESRLCDDNEPEASNFDIDDCCEHCKNGWCTSKEVAESESACDDAVKHQNPKYGTGCLRAI